MLKHYKKKIQDRSKNKFNFIYQFIKAIIRGSLVLLLVHRAFVTSFGDYGEAIDKKTKTIHEVKTVEQKLYDHNELKIPAKVQLNEENLNSQIALKDIEPEEVAKEREEIRKETKKDIRHNLNESDKGITYNKISLEYDENNQEWKKRSKGESFIRDPQRFLFIQPLQTISEKLGIEKYLILDILLKVLIFRLFLNWISYPQDTMSLGGEENEKLQDPYLHPEEREKISKKMQNRLKHVLFNLAAMFFFTLCISLHPFAFNKSDSLYSSSTSKFIWIFPLYLIISVLSSISNNYLLQKKSWEEFSRKNLLSSVAVPFLISLVSCFWVKEFGGLLYFAFSELINLLINLVRIFLKHRKQKNKK